MINEKPVTKSFDVVLKRYLVGHLQIQSLHQI
jgi:hypothetical protein